MHGIDFDNNLEKHYTGTIKESEKNPKIFRIYQIPDNYFPEQIFLQFLPI